MEVDAEQAKRLAYYASMDQFGVLAPRGWYCFGTYGSDGNSLYVSPQPINPDDFFSTTWTGIAEPVIQLSQIDGGASGRTAVAEAIARVFPAHRSFITEMSQQGGTEPARAFPSGPYPNDGLIYKSPEIVEFLTPAHTDGLGTNERVHSNSHPIRGVAILIASGQETNILRLSARLPAKEIDLASSIIQQVERDAADQATTTSTAAAAQNQTDNSSRLSSPSEAEHGYPVSEEVFVDAFVLANSGREDLDNGELDQMGHRDYQMGRSINTQVLLLGGELMNTMAGRAMNYLDRLNRQQQKMQ